MKAKPYRLLVVAHPDDETIFFGGLVQSLRDAPWHVICLTDANADGRGEERHREFLSAAKLLKLAKAEQWEYRDLFATRLPVNEIAARLAALPKPKEVFTHGPLGEYGHAHHQDACLAVTRAFCKTKVPVWSPAWNCSGEKQLLLTKAQYDKKTKAYAEIYAKETLRFTNVLPNFGQEAFTRFQPAEVEALVTFFRRERTLAPKALKKYRWLAPQLESLRDRLEQRLF